jgi:hypothetical protein
MTSEVHESYTEYLTLTLSDILAEVLTRSPHCLLSCTRTLLSGRNCNLVPYCNGYPPAEDAEHQQPFILCFQMSVCTGGLAWGSTLCRDVSYNLWHGCGGAMAPERESFAVRDVDHEVQQK